MSSLRSSSGRGIMGRTSADCGGHGQKMKNNEINYPHCFALLDPVRYCRPAAGPQDFPKPLSLMADLMPDLQNQEKQPFPAGLGRPALSRPIVDRVLEYWPMWMQASLE